MGLIRMILRAVLYHPPAPTHRVPQPRPRSMPSPRVVKQAPAPLCGKCYVIDGDTIIIKRQNIRLFGIDAPELDHPWGQNSKWFLHRLCKGHLVTARVTGELSYNRRIARCFLPDGRDLSAEMVKHGLAIDWPKYSGGLYGHLEAPDIREKLWRAARRQDGRTPIIH